MPFIELMFLATVPMPCADCLLTLPIASHVGLTVSNCSITLLPDAYTTLRIRAVPTAGANARIVPLTFGAIDAAGSPWHGLEMHTILVQCNAHFICCSRCLLYSHNIVYHLRFLFGVRFSITYMLISNCSFVIVQAISFIYTCNVISSAVCQMS